MDLDAPARLDPNLFDNRDRVHPVVREFLLTTTHKFLAASFSSPQSWLCVYLVGAGASYQPGSEAGEDGELDVLLCVDWHTFYAHQSLETAQIPISALTNILNFLLRNNLVPKLASTTLGERAYEVTVHVDALGKVLETSKPYAVYDLSADRWLSRATMGRG